VVTRLEFAQGRAEGSDVVRVHFRSPSLCMLRVEEGVRGALRIEVRTKDGGRVLNRDQTPGAEVVVDIPSRIPPGSAVQSEGAVEADGQAVQSVSAVEPDLITLEVPRGTRRVRLGFEPTKAERLLLERLAKDGGITERAANRLLSAKGSGLVLSGLLEKLLHNGHRFVQRDEDGDEGATYVFRRELIS